ncbi:hypothetical protein H8D83_00685 [Candidatus Woesearchaeota archaeon]|nr:hypothetical protein [Candidatus Woesearchaeota archaeon]MBL7050663.1 hypothetical protein [Candidatus Woesearchaeota archaeon]
MKKLELKPETIGDIVRGLTESKCRPIIVQVTADEGLYKIGQVLKISDNYALEIRDIEPLNGPKKPCNYYAIPYKLVQDD